MKKIVLFFVPFLITIIAVVGYFKLTQKILTIGIPNLPSISFSDLVKFSRFSLEKAPAQSLVGTISSMSGDIEYESRTATGAARLTSPVTIQQGETLSTGMDGNLTLTFEKSAEINISSDSSVGIIQTLPADMVFSQSRGAVEYKKLANIPVTIRSYHLLIENRGDITVSIDKIYPIVTVNINSGSATFAYNNTNNISRVWNFDAGTTLTFNDDTRRVVAK